MPVGIQHPSTKNVPVLTTQFLLPERIQVADAKGLPIKSARPISFNFPSRLHRLEHSLLNFEAGNYILAASCSLAY
jgi:hypothetical protein